MPLDPFRKRWHLLPFVTPQEKLVIVIVNPGLHVVKGIRI
jgi:hypothetical protein